MSPTPRTMRSVIYFRTPHEGAEPHVLIAVLVEDQDGVWIEPLFEAQGLPPWCTRGPVGSDHALLRQRAFPMPGQPGHDRLEFFTRTDLSSAMVGGYRYGEITQHPDWRGTAPHLAAKLAAALLDAQ